MSRRFSKAFTLVELLVVIGIISVLISALLPALGRARAAANSIDCQARLRQMGQALQIYTVNNKGLLPWGVVRHDAAWTDHTIPNPSNRETYWWWTFTLSDTLQKGLIQSDGFVHGISPIFRDKDTIDPPAEARYVNHYTVNQRLMWNTNDVDSTPSAYHPGAPNRMGNDLVQRKVASIKPSGVFVIWDGPQAMDYGYNAYELATEMDGNQITFGHCFVRGSTSAGINYGRPVVPGGRGQTQNASVARAAQKKFNNDLVSAFGAPDGWTTHLRFRHMKNTQLNALCLDGHVESRKVGEAMLLDFCTNYPY